MEVEVDTGGAWRWSGKRLPNPAGEQQSDRAELPRGRTVKARYRTRSRQMGRWTGRQTTVRAGCLEQRVPRRGET